MSHNLALPSQCSLGFLLRQTGIAASYAALLYMGEMFFESEGAFGYFEASAGFALASLLLIGKQYAWGLLLGGILLRLIIGEDFQVALINSFGDVLQAILAVQLINYKRTFNQNLKTLRDYLVLILLGGCVSIAIGSLVVNTALWLSGVLPPENIIEALIKWWFSDTLGVILITPLMLVWWVKDNKWHSRMHLTEAILLLAATIIACQWIFIDLWHGNTPSNLAKSYWMFLLVTWAAVRLGRRETTVVLVLTAIYALQGANFGAGYFANDIEETQLANYWLYMTILSVVGMALATYITEHKLAAKEIYNLAF